MCKCLKYVAILNVDRRETNEQPLSGIDSSHDRRHYPKDLDSEGDLESKYIHA